MKIIHIVSTYPPYKGGMGNVVFEEVKELAKRGHEVHVATLADDKVETVNENGVTVHRCASEIRWGKAGISLQIDRLMRDASFDVVHLHVPFFGVQELAVLRMWLGWRPANVVMTYHMDIVVGGMVGAVAAISRRLFLGALVKRAWQIVVASEDYAMSSWLTSWEGVVRKKMVEAPFGVDVNRFYPPESSPPYEGGVGGGLSDAPAQLMFLGGLDRNHYFKGLEVLIRALTHLKDRDDWKLIVVGDGDLRHGYEQQVRDAGLEGRITFLGREIGRAEQHYRESDVFVFPSVDRSEAFGLVALEAQASGTPVVASNLDGVRTVVQDKETGLLVPPQDNLALADAIAWMLDHPKKRRAMGKAARTRVEARYTWPAHVATLEALYRTS